ncbi:MAG: GDSL-type esterase/lipase family protein [Candidatus Binatia bacterium]|nr:GDSL-type esterase/lipase family protein [Candidatus Binatia bacterium]
MPHDGESGMIRASRWALFAASLVTALIAAELLLRAFGLPDSLPAPPAPSTIDPYEANPYIVSRRPYGAMFLPGSTYRAERPSYVVDYEINAHGFRGPAIESKTDRRLLVIGDSIPEGHGVPAEESVPTRLDRALNGSRWSVVSAAMQGGSPLQYAANVPRYLALEPDAVLLVLYENDLWDDRAKESNYFALPVLVDKPAPHLWTLARTLTSPPVDTPLEAQIRKNRDTPLPAYPPDPVSPIVVPPEAFEAEWNQSAAYLDALADELEKHEIPLFVAVYALGTLVPRAPEAHRLHAENLERSARTWSEGRSVPFLSLFQVTRGALAELPWEEVLIPDDGHPTTEMHRRLALELTPWLRTHLP